MTTATPSEIAVTRKSAHRELIETLVVLFKLRVVALLLFAAFGGALLGSAGAFTWSDVALLLVTGTLSAAGASALNQYIERYKDAAMKRTHHRPLVTGQVDARWVLLLAALMVVGASAMALVAGNVPLAIWLAVGAFIYVGVYTIWLKPRSVLNVVIGGAAGSAAVISGGAAVGHWSDPRVLLLGALLFTWSPMHFWSLALAYRSDYARAGVPMLPVVVSPRRAVFWMVLHAVATVIIGVLLGLDGTLGWLYAIPIAVGTLWLLRETAKLVTQYTGGQAMRVFHASNLYLSLVLLAICVAVLV
jgi:protoheme IX farnesyltransferase